MKVVKISNLVNVFYYGIYDLNNKIHYIDHNDHSDEYIADKDYIFEIYKSLKYSNKFKILI